MARILRLGAPRRPITVALIGLLFATFFSASPFEADDAYAADDPPDDGECAEVSGQIICDVTGVVLDFSVVGDNDQNDGGSNIGASPPPAVGQEFDYSAVFTSSGGDGTVVDATVKVTAITNSPLVVDGVDNFFAPNSVSIAVEPGNGSVTLEVSFYEQGTGDAVKMKDLSVLVSDLDKTSSRTESASFTGLTRYTLTTNTTIRDSVSGGTATFTGSADLAAGGDVRGIVKVDFPTLSMVGLTATSTNGGGIGFIFDSSDPWGGTSTDPTTVTPPSYTVSFDYDGGTGTNSSVSGSGEVDFPSFVNQSKGGIQLSSWAPTRGGTTGRIPEGGSYTPLADVTYFAIYEASVTPSATTSATVGSAFSATPTTSGFTSSDLTFSIASGALPAGLSLDTATGTISGTPTAAGDFTVTLRATHDLGGIATSANYDLTVAKGTQAFSWSPTTSLTLADSGLALSATQTTGDGDVSYSVVDAGTTACEVGDDDVTLTFASTGSGANGCEVRPVAAESSNYLAKNDSSTVTFDVARGTFAITSPSSKVESTSSSFTNVCATTCDVSGFASADEILVVVSAADGSSLEGRVRLTSDTGLTQSLSGYQDDATDAGGFSELGFEGTQAEVNAALETLQYKSPTGGGNESIGISASLAGAAYFAGTGHYYEVISGDNKNHADAITAASSRTFNGLTGYLATILTEEENRFIDSKISDRSVWIGGKYNGTVWQWITGPVAEQIDFWTGTNRGSPIPGAYSEWEPPHQPDGSDVCLSTNYDSPSDSDTEGNWDDLTCTATKKWVVEYGGNGGTVLKEASTTFSVGPPAPATTNGGGSGGGTTTTVAPLVTPVLTPPTPALPRILTPPQATPRPTIMQGPITSPGRGFDPSIGTRATIGGAPATVAKRVLPTGGLAVQTGALQFGLALKDPQGGGGVDTSTPSNTPELRVPTGQSTQFSGGGLLPGSQLQVWLPGRTGEQAKELARVPVKEDGSFETELSFTARQTETPVPIGRQVMQVAGFDENGNQTVVDMTINVSQGPISPEPNREEGILPDLAIGSSLATSAGIPTPVTVIPLPDERRVSVGDGSWTLQVDVDPESGVVEGTSDAPVIRIRQGTTALASGDGFMPGTTASVWMFSDPTLMGTVSVAEDGSFTTEFMVDPLFLPAGEHTLQVQGVGEDGFIKAANLGVAIEEPVALTSDSSLGVLWWVAGVVVAILAMFFIVLLRRRKRA